MNERPIPYRILKTSITSMASMATKYPAIYPIKVPMPTKNSMFSFYNMYLKSIFRKHKMKNDLKENKKREGEVRKFSQNPLAYPRRS